MKHYDMGRHDGELLAKPPKMQQYNAEDENWYQTQERLATLESVLADEQMTFDKCKELLSGKRGFLCQYEK